MTPCGSNEIATSDESAGALLARRCESSPGMAPTSLTVRETLDPEPVRAVAYRVIGLVVMLLVLGLATFLPGSGRTLPGINVAVYDLVVASGTLVIVGWLGQAATDVGALVEAALDGPEAVVRDLGRAAAALVGFLAVLVGYRGLAGLVVPPLARRGIAWGYDLTFLVLGLLALAVVANRLRRNLHAIAAVVAHAAVAEDERPDADEGPGA